MGTDTAELSLSRETLIAVAAKFVLAVTGFVGVVIFSRVLGVSGVGKYYAILAAAKLLSQISSGVNGAIKKRVSEVDTPSAEYFGLGLAANAAFVVIVAVASVLVYPVVRERIGPFAFLVGFVGVVASLSGFALVNRLYSGIGNPGASFWTDTLRSILTLAGQVTLLWLGWNVLGLLIGFIAGTVATTLVVFVIVRMRPRLPSRRTIRRTYEFARWNVVNGLLQNMYSRIDVLLLYAIVGSAAVGLYEPALRLVIPATFVSASIGDSLMVKSSGLDSLGRDVREDLENAVSYAAMLAIPIFFGCLVLAEPLMRVVYGPDFAAGATALILLAAFQLFNTFRDPFSDIVAGIDRPDLQFRVRVAILLIHLPLAVFFGLEYGLLGVVVATLFTEFVRAVLYELLAWRLFEGVVLPRPVAHQVFSGLVMFGVVWWAARQIVITGWIRLLAVVGLGGAVYFLTLSITSRHFRTTVGDALAGVGFTRPL